MRYQFIDEQKKAYPLKVLCTVMEVSRSGYYRYRKPEPGKKTKDEARLLVEVKLLAQESRNSYGSRMMSKNLRHRGYEIGRYAARSLMRKLGIECKQRRRYRLTTQSNHKLPIAGNMLNREFNALQPDQKWTTDITYIHTLEGWLYLAIVLDLFSRRIVGWSMAKHMRDSLVQDALHMALGRRQPAKSLLHHSDRGVQYASKSYQSILRDYGITVSMSRKGNCWDNSVAERFFGSLKSERTDSTIYKTREEAKADIIDYIEMFYNSKRLHSTLNYVSPVQFEKQFFLKKVSTFI